jgi:hypothetical protein
VPRNASYDSTASRRRTSAASGTSRHVSEHVFLLSPARCDGERARVLLNPDAPFDLAVRLRSRDGIALGEAFSFLSGLYFRGKLAYAREFGPTGRSALVITTNRGLLSPEERVRRPDLVAFSRVDIAGADRRFVKPLCRSAESLRTSLDRDACVVLLGSIATAKYVGPLLEVFGERLLFPSDFVGRGDMSRGGLLLRCVREQRELTYERVAGAVRHGKRPAKLERLR